MVDDVTGGPIPESVSHATVGRLADHDEIGGFLLSHLCHGTALAVGDQRRLTGQPAD
jgi:hypothetical protein